MRALAIELGERGIVTSEVSVWRLVRDARLSFKNVWPAEPDRRDGARKCRFWKEYQGRRAPERLVFLDATWAKTNMTRTRGWSPQGAPLLSKVPHGHWKTLTFLAALRSDRIDAPCVLDGPINGPKALPPISSNSWSRHYRPATSSSWIISAATKAPPRAKLCATQAPSSCSCRPTSPDLNPIEQVFAKLKTLLRKAAERTVEAIWKRIGTLLKAFKPEECANYLRNSGYAPN